MYAANSAMSADATTSLVQWRKASIRAQATPIARTMATIRSGVLREPKSRTPARENAEMVWPLGKDAATCARTAGPSHSSGRARATAYLIAYATMPAARPPSAIATAYSIQRRCL
jgi:hypothetical protein